ncbi:peptidase S8/S53 domain-containing protein, partial [Lactarius psammicola]
YNKFDYKPAATDRNMLRIMGFLGDYPSPADLTAFMRKYRSNGVDAMFTVEQVNNGGYNLTHPHEEANVVLQYAKAMAYLTPHIFYSTGQGPSGTDDWYTSWLRYIIDQKRIPQTISTLYVTDENTISEEYAIYVCLLYAQLGSCGVSILFSTGNDGIGEGNCVTNDGSVRFIPKFPTTCPYVTAVGGTKEYLLEVTAEISGGGFSNHFERLWYQDQAVPTFFQNLSSKYQGLYNASSCGIPNIAAQVMDFRVFFKGVEKEKDGVSIVTPVVAGIISLLNDWLISNGLAPLGFLNPWLYVTDLRLALNDITRGANPGCNTPGFPTTIGWDPV